MGLLSKWMKGKEEEQDSSVTLELAESLSVAVRDAGLKPSQLRLNVPVSGQNIERCSLFISDGMHDARWQVDTLASLFRGSRMPPPESEMAHYPEEYVAFFHGIESVALTFCMANDCKPTDAQFLDVYTFMRRRPDGKSLGGLHDAVWQSAALNLALAPLSEAEYLAAFGQLARSARHFKMGPSSRNYISYVTDTFGKIGR